MQAPVPKRKLTTNPQELKLVPPAIENQSPARQPALTRPAATAEAGAEGSTSYRCTCAPRSRPCDMHLLSSLIGGPRH